MGKELEPTTAMNAVYQDKTNILFSVKDSILCYIMYFRVERMIEEVVFSVGIWNA